LKHEKKILRLNTQAFDEAWHLQYAHIHLRDNWSPARWKKELMYFVVDWLSETESIAAQTSGSTGIPKKILLPKKYMKASARMTLGFFGLKPGDKALLCLPIRYIAAKMMVVRAFTGKLDLYCIQPNLYPYSEWMPSLDFAAMTPAQAEKLLERKLQSLKTEVWHSYGMTETMSHVALRKVNGRDKMASFRPLPGVSLSRDRDGCLRITAPFIGVFNLGTHDVVEFLEEDRFRVLGRTDNVINSGGVKLFPEKIEQKLSSWITVPFYIGKQPDRLLGERPVLFIESKTWLEKRVALLYQQMKNTLEKFELPDKIVFVEKFVRTDSGKIVRSSKQSQG